MRDHFVPSIPSNGGEVSMPAHDREYWRWMFAGQLCSVYVRRGNFTADEASRAAVKLADALINQLLLPD